MNVPVAFSLDALRIDPPKEAARIQAAIRDAVFQDLRRKGVVLGLSGGVDSSVVAALCVCALGEDRVLGLFMPEADSSPDSLRLGLLVANTLGIKTVLEDIGPILEAARCYQRRNDAIRTVLPEFQDDWKCKIALSSQPDQSSYGIYSVVAQSPDGRKFQARLTKEAHLGIVSATNFKQRTRKMIEHYHSDRLQYAVVGTPNRLEYDQGFFVKNGDAAADLKPIAHLYKGQVYELAKYLEIPQEIQRRSPTTDTYSMEQSQEEFYFALPLEKMDVCLYGKNHGIPASEVASALGVSVELVEKVYSAIDRKRRATRYLHRKPLLVEAIREIEP